MVGSQLGDDGSAKEVGPCLKLRVSERKLVVKDDNGVGPGKDMTTEERETRSWARAVVTGVTHREFSEEITRVITYQPNAIKPKMCFFHQQQFVSLFFLNSMLRARNANKYKEPPTEKGYS